MDQALEKARKALEACRAWHWAEATTGAATFHEKMELCKYSEYLTTDALAAINGQTFEEAYAGIPQMVVWPEIHLLQADQEQAQAIVDRVIGAWRETLRAHVGGAA